MPEHPHLIFFPPPAVERRRLPRAHPPALHFPPVGQRADRVRPMLRAAEEALAHRRAEFITDVGRIQPEEALVFETIGSVQAFLGAIRRTPGLEWLAEAA